MALAPALTWLSWTTVILAMIGGAAFSIWAERREGSNQLWWVGGVIVVAGFLLLFALAEIEADEDFKSTRNGLAAGRCKEIHDLRDLQAQAAPWK